MLFWYREGKYALHMMQLPPGKELFNNNHNQSPSPAKPKISKLAWVDVHCLLEAVRNSMVHGDARIKQGSIRNVVSVLTILR